MTKQTFLVVTNKQIIERVFRFADKTNLPRDVVLAKTVEYALEEKFSHAVRYAYKVITGKRFVLR